MANRRRTDDSDAASRRLGGKRENAGLAVILSLIAD